MDTTPVNKIYPFKFNPVWSKDDDFKCLVFSVWQDNKYLLEEGSQRRLVWKMRYLKQPTKVWSKKKEDLLKRSLINLEAQIKDAYLSLDGSNSMNEKEVLLGILEKERNQILIYNEEKWCQKSRATWIESGDSNTIFFHNFASERSKQKTI
jgi:hypothetical protein